MKKFFAKLVGTWNQRENTAERIHETEQKDKNKEHAELAKERHDEIMRNRNKKFVSERTDPGETVLGPSESESEKA